MIEPIPSLNESANLATEYSAEAEACVRRNPGATLLVALGVGLAAAVLVRALRPEPKPQHRLAALLEDLEDRLREIGTPALRKAGSLASESAQALGDGVHHGEAQVEKFVRDAGRRLRRYWS